MKTFNSFSVAVAFTALTLFTGAVNAQMNMDHGNMAGTKMNSQASAAMTDGEVRKVDMDAKKITIRHGAIENLGMPPMTMVFQVKDPALLDQVKAGDKVRFSAEKVGGAFIITRIEDAK